MQNITKSEQFIIRVIDIFLINYIIVVIILSNTILYLMVCIGVAFEV